MTLCKIVHSRLCCSVRPTEGFVVEKRNPPEWCLFDSKGPVPGQQFVVTSHGFPFADWVVCGNSILSALGALLSLCRRRSGAGSFADGFSVAQRCQLRTCVRGCEA